MQELARAIELARARDRARDEIIDTIYDEIEKV